MRGDPLDGYPGFDADTVVRRLALDLYEIRMISHVSQQGPCGFVPLSTSSFSTTRLFAAA